MILVIFPLRVHKHSDLDLQKYAEGSYDVRLTYWFTTWVEFIYWYTAAQVKLMKNFNSTNKPFIIGSHLWQPPLPPTAWSIGLWSRLCSTVDMRWKRNDNPIDPCNWLIYKQFLSAGKRDICSHHFPFFRLLGQLKYKLNQWHTHTKHTYTHSKLPVRECHWGN